MEDILNGSTSLHELVDKCVLGLEKEQRGKVLQEFSVKFTERAKEYLLMAAKREENWTRLEQMALEDGDLTDVERPEPVSDIKTRIIMALNDLEKHTYGDCIIELKTLCQK